MEVLRRLATGASNQQIAYDLTISVNTVKVHIRNIFEKLGVSSRTEATLVAIQSGWVQVGSDVAAEGVVDNGRLQSSGLESSTRRFRVNRPWFMLAVVALVIIVAGATWFVSAASKPEVNAGSTRASLTTPPAGRVRARSPMPTARAGLASVVHNFRVYAIGGETPTGLTGAVERYDPRADQWVSLAAKPVPVRGAGAAVVRGKIYVPGGCTEADRALSILEVYDPEADLWSQGPDLPAPVCEYAIAALEGQVYLFGGRDGTRYKANAYAFDPRENRWLELPSMPTARAGAAAAAGEGRIFVVGGTNGSELNITEVYFPGREAGAAWESVASLPQGRSGLGLVTIGNSLYAVGGDTSGRAQSVFQYDLTSDTWTQVNLGRVEFPRQAGVVELDASKILVLGGWMGKPQATTSEFTVRYQIFLP